jgi:hypothetical protein
MLKLLGMTLLMTGVCLSACAPLKTHVCGRAGVSESVFMEMLTGSRSAIGPTEFLVKICDGSACKTAIHWTRGNKPSFKIDGRKITMRIPKGVGNIRVKRKIDVNSVRYEFDLIETDGPIPDADIPGDIEAVNNCGWLRAK